MANSPRLQWPIPNSGDDPWYDKFVAFVNSADASAYAAREDRNTVIMGGGTVAFTASSGLLAWSADIQFLSADNAILWSIATGTATISDGSMLYVDLVRPPISNVYVATNVVAQLPNSDTALLVCIRRGTILYFRDGLVLLDGQSIPLFMGGGSGASVGSAIPISVNAGDTGTAGVSALASRQDHQHPVNTAGAGDLAVADAGVADAGTSISVPRADHKHQISTAAPSAQIIGAGSTGTSTSLPHADHVHPMTAGNPTAQTIGLGQTGVATTVAASDHVHPMTAGAPAANVIGVGSTGSSTSVSAADHVHAMSAAAPASQVIGAGTTGVATTVAASDHVHPMSDAAPVSTSTTNANGSATTVSRSDHIHRTALTVDSAASVIGARPILNFVSGATVVDNPGADRVDVTISSGGGSSGQKIRRAHSMAINENTPSSTYVVGGDFPLNPSDYALLNTTFFAYFQVVVYVTNGATTANVQLYNLTDATIVSTQTSSAIVPTKLISGSLSLPASEKMYEIRFWVTGGNGITDLVNVSWAGLIIDNQY